MGIGFSMLLFAAGAIMRYAVTVEADGFDLHTAGVILMVVGIVGAIVSAMNWTTWGGFGSRTATRGHDTVVRETEVR